MNKLSLGAWIAISCLMVISGKSMAIDANSTLPDGDKKVEIFDLIADTMDLACVDYKIKGVCFWLHCAGPYCRVRTSSVVSHYNPDVIVETVSNREAYPLTWLTKPMSQVTDPLARGLNHGFDVGTGVRGSPTGTATNKNFFDTNVYGNPALLGFRDIVGSMLSLSGFCNSDVMPFNPYFVSTLDPEWRMGLLEAPLLVLPSNFNRKIFAKSGDALSGTVGSALGGYGDIVQSSERFGYIFPRIGSIVNPNRYISSTVIAQRAADIVTSLNAHIYQKLPDTAGSAKVWAPVPPREGDAETAKWQRNYPRGKTECKAFPADSSEEFKYSEDDFSPTHNYLYTLWRRYECCARRGTFLYRI